MPKPANWQEIGVAPGLPRLYTEHELARMFHLSTYAMYHLRRLGVVAPVAWGKRSLLYNKDTVDWMLRHHVLTEDGSSYISITHDQGAEFVY